MPLGVQAVDMAAAEFKTWEGWREAAKAAKVRAKDLTRVGEAEVHFVVAQRLKWPDVWTWPGRHCDIRYAAEQCGYTIGMREVKTILGEVKRKRVTRDDARAQAKRARVQKGK
eukprot:Hpha_TRINITY_DN16790_c3_g2::TRINITY_DN16790_c3_g2_i1::g.80109::m.80109